MTSFINWVSDVFVKTFGNRNASDAKIIMVGLDAAGKTTLLYRMKQAREEVTAIVPTIGFNVEVLITKLGAFTCWDVGGCDKIRTLWRHYLQGAAGIIFVVDSNDLERIEEVKEQMNYFLRENHVPTLIVANKQDLPRAMPIVEVVDRLGLKEIKNLPWDIIATCAPTGDGLDKLLIWMRDLSNKRDMRGFVLNESEVAAAGYAKHQLSISDQTYQAWLSRVDTPVENFLYLANRYELDLWDHFNHVRLAFCLLSSNIDDTEAGIGQVSDLFQRFIEQSPRTDGKSFHITMTRFFCILILHWIHRWIVDEVSNRRSTDFWRFLRFVSVHKLEVDDLADKAVFKVYYSGNVIFAPEARSSFVEPDLRPLPSLSL